jgi:hypothetical protein
LDAEIVEAPPRDLAIEERCHGDPMGRADRDLHVREFVECRGIARAAVDGHIRARFLDRGPNGYARDRLERFVEPPQRGGCEGLLVVADTGSIVRTLRTRTRATEHLRVDALECFRDGRSRAADETEDASVAHVDSLQERSRAHFEELHGEDEVVLDARERSCDTDVDAEHTERAQFTARVDAADTHLVEDGHALFARHDERTALPERVERTRSDFVREFLQEMDRERPFEFEHAHAQPIETEGHHRRRQRQHDDESEENPHAVVTLARVSLRPASARAVPM